jgi:predicted PurR-regulated permease PerM
LTEHGAPQHDHRRDILFAFALGLAVYLAWLLRGVLVMLYVSALFAVVLTPVVNSTAKLHIGHRRLGRGPAILFLLVGTACAFAVFGFLTIPPVVRDLEQFSWQAPSRIPELLARFQQIPLANRLNGAELSSRLQGLASQAVAYVLISAGNWAGNLFDIVTGLVLTIYFILEGDHAYDWFLSFLSPVRRERLDGALRRAGVGMGKWLLGQATLMLILGVTSTVVYLSLHIRYAYALGVLTGMLNIIPVLGAAVSIALVALVAAIDSWGRVLGVAIFFAIYVNLENTYLVPRIMRTRVNLPGLAILVSLMMGFSLSGILGGLVAVPTAVLVAVLLDEYLVCKDVKAGT